MNYLLIIIIFTFSVKSRGQDCRDLPLKFNTYQEAISRIRNSNFVLKESLVVSNSSWISSAKYFSCDNQRGYLIYVTLNGREYIHDKVPVGIWQSFKRAESKGEYYIRHIKGKFKLLIKSSN